jgi:hypothetical protein
MKKVLNLFRRGKVWRAFVPNSLIESNARAAALEIQLQTLAAEVTALREQALTSARLRLVGFEQQLASRLPSLGRENDVILLVQRRNELLVLAAPRAEAVSKQLAGMKPLQVVEAIVNGAITTATLLTRNPAGISGLPIPAFLNCVREHPDSALNWLDERQPVLSKEAAPYFEQLDGILTELGLIDFFAHGVRIANNELTPPFDQPSNMPVYVPAQPKKRSVLFAHHCYYNFYYLAKALRRRGWDAVTLSLDDSASGDSMYSHGEDIHIYHPDPEHHRNLVSDFFSDNIHRFGMIHTYGIGILSLFRENYDLGRIDLKIPWDMLKIPWDMLEAKRRGILLGYSHCGCMDAVAQSTFRGWSPSMCANCVWESRPDVCSDRGNLSWGRKMTSIVDLFCTETDPPLDFKASPNAFRGPLTFAINPEVWRTDLEIPDRFRRERTDGEIIVYHAMGNYELRSRNGRNVKGTQSIITAVEELRAEGIPIRLDFVKDVSSIDNRYIQAQADIIVDQLNYGRYGALAREGMMLGKPVVGRVNKMDGPDLPATQCILETPIVHADEQTIKDVLRDLALNPEKRHTVGMRSREHALHWWSDDRLAARFEQVHDHLREHGVPPAEEDVR